MTPSNRAEQTGLQLSFSFNNRRGEAAASCCSAVRADGGAEAERYRGRRNQVSGSRLHSEGRDVRECESSPPVFGAHFEPRHHKWLMEMAKFRRKFSSMLKRVTLFFVFVGKYFSNNRKWKSCDGGNIYRWFLPPKAAQEAFPPSSSQAKTLLIKQNKKQSVCVKLRANKDLLQALPPGEHLRPRFRPGIVQTETGNRILQLCFSNISKVLQKSVREASWTCPASTTSF